TVVDDQIGCPTFTGHLAGALVSLAERRVPGIVHVASGGACTRFEFAREIVRRVGVSCEVVPGSTAALGRPAPRPAYSVLDTGRGRRRRGGVRRRRQLRGRDPCGPVDLWPRGVHHHQYAGHARPARGGARAGLALPPGLDRRGVWVDRERLIHRGLAAPAIIAV